MEVIVGVAGIISKKISCIHSTDRTAFALHHKLELRLYRVETDNPDLFSTCKSFPVPGTFAAEFEGKLLYGVPIDAWVFQADGLVKKAMSEIVYVWGRAELLSCVL